MHTRGTEGERPLPYNLTTEQLLALTHAPRRLLDAAEALQLYTVATEHAIQARHAAELLASAFPEIEHYWLAVVEDALRERERQRRC